MTTTPARQQLEAKAVWFESPRNAVLRSEFVSPPADDEVLVEAVVSLISAGTELLVYRGLVSAETPLGLETCAGSFGFPVKYAYQVVGRVIEAGARTQFEEGDLVFCKHPHQSLFTIRDDPRLVWRLPASVAPTVAAFTQLSLVALTALLDMPVRLGDNVVVFGQGIVGQFCALFASKTARNVYVVDPSPGRQRRAKDLGFTVFSADEAVEGIRNATNGAGVDIAFEASGSPQALQQAILGLGQEGTVVALSYYGTQPVTLTLAPEFHFGRHRIVSSQAAQIGSGLQPRWDRMRRATLATEVLADLPVQSMVSHEIPFESAPEAYRILDEGDDEVFGVLLKY